MRRAALAGLALALAAAAGAQSPPPDVPPGPARIEGLVLRSDTGSPVGDAEVALYALTAEGVPGLRRTKSDAEGRFVFENVASDPSVGWLVGARYEGVAFPGGRVDFAPGANVASLEIRVDPPTRDPAAVRVGEHSLRLLREPGGLRVFETLTLRNDGTHTYYVPAAERARGRAALETGIPAAADGFEMPLGVVPEGLVRSGSRITWYGPVLRGSQELSWSYRLAPEPGSGTEEGERYAFALHVPAGTERLVLLLAAPDATLEAEGLAGPESIEVDGQPMRRFSEEHPRAGSHGVRLTLPPARLDPGAVSVSEVQAVLRSDDAALEVNETHTLQVAGDHHVLGNAEAPLLRIPLPEGVSKLRFGSDASGILLVPDGDGGLEVQGVVAPGEAHVELAYQLAVHEPPARFVRRLAARTPLLSIFVADTGRLAPRTERLHRRRPVQTSDLTYLHFEAFEVAAGEEVALELGSLPPRSATSGGVALAAVFAASLVAGWLLIQPLRGRTTGTEATPDEELSPARREREALYAAIRDLDHDFETGKVAADDHARLRDELRARAALLLAEEQRRTEAVPSAPPAGCARCGAGAGEGHRFCSQCGAPLGTGGAPA